MPNGLLPSGFKIKILYALFHPRARAHAHTHTNLIILFAYFVKHDPDLTTVTSKSVLYHYQ